MRRPLLVALALLAAACGPAPAPSAPAPAAPAPHTGRFTVLQINDLYRIEGLEGGRLGGLARVRALRKQLEAEGRPVLVLHAGDILFPSVMSKFLRARPMIEILNRLDGDPAARDPRLVAVFGNHELDDPDPGVLLGRAAQSDFTWLSSTVGYRSTRSAPPEPLSRRLTNVKDALVVDLGGTKVGLFGITTDEQQRDYAAVSHSPEARKAAARAGIEAVKQGGAHVVVALTHQDLEDDVALAGDFPEIDLVVGGHEHLFLERKVGRTWVTKADADAVTAIVHDVVIQGGRVETTHRKVTLDASMPKDPEVERDVQGWLAELGRVLTAESGKDPFAPIGSTEHLLEGVEPAVRGRETALGNFLTDVIRDRMATDLAILNGGAVRLNDNLPPGPLRTYDLEGIFYFDQPLVAFELSGRELVDVLRNGVARVHAGAGQFLQVSSIRFRYHPGGTPDKPTYRVDPADVSVRPRGSKDFAPLDLDRRYTVASIQYLWESGCKSGAPVFGKACGGQSPKRVDAGPPPSWRKSTEAAIAALPERRVTARVEGRITRAE